MPETSHMIGAMLLIIANGIGQMSFDGKGR